MAIGIGWIGHPALIRCQETNFHIRLVTELVTFRNHSNCSSGRWHHIIGNNIPYHR